MPEIITIKAWINGAQLFQVEAESIKEALEKAVAAGANLGGADLRGAYLDGANLRGAYLGGAYLDGANLGNSTTLDTGETWGQYLSEVVPALLTAGGKTLEEVLATGCWDCHKWCNCPMHVALGINGESEAPVLLRPRVRQFVQLFDAKLIPAPQVGVTDAQASAE